MENFELIGTGPSVSGVLWVVLYDRVNSQYWAVLTEGTESCFDVEDNYQAIEISEDEIKKYI